MHRIPDKLLSHGCKQIIFEHHWREDFVGAALTLEIGPCRKLKTIEFYSASLGIIRWTSNLGLGQARGWEEPEKCGSGLRSRFPCALLNGPLEFLGGDRIIKCVLATLPTHSILPFLIRAALTEPSKPLRLPHQLSSFRFDNSAKKKGRQYTRTDDP